jgi:hypothetical protein
MMTSVGLHLLALVLLMLIPMTVISPSTTPRELDVVFHRPPPAAVPIPAPPIALPKGPEHSGRPAGPVIPKAPQPSNAPEAPGQPEQPPGPPEPPQEPIGRSGILALHDQFANLAKEKPGPRLGRDARFSDAVDRGENSSPSALTTNRPGSSGGIDTATLRRTVGGGGGGAFPGVGGGGAGGGGAGGYGLEPGRATSPIAPGGDRPLAHGGPGPARTDEEIQIVFDRYKASFYRLYNRELRKDPTLKGQMVIRLTIEPDGSVSMCKLQSSDMNAPDLATQVVGIVLTINFGAKEGVKALTIPYPIDFLPAN